MPSSSTIEAHVLEDSDATYQVDGSFRPKGSLALLTPSYWIFHLLILHFNTLEFRFDGPLRHLSIKFFKTIAWLCCSSAALYTSVIGLLRDILARFRSSLYILGVLNSVLYRRRNSFHLGNLCPNHLRSEAVGAKSFRHATMRARFLLIPRGQTRSTKIRIPSQGVASLYTRLIRIMRYPLSVVKVSPPRSPIHARRRSWRLTAYATRPFFSTGRFNS